MYPADMRAPAFPIREAGRATSPGHKGTGALYLEVVFAMYSEPMTEYIPGDHHVGLHAIHSQAVHAQELRQEGIAMTLHYELVVFL